MGLGELLLHDASHFASYLFHKLDMHICFCAKEKATYIKKCDYLVLWKFISNGLPVWGRDQMSWIQDFFLFSFPIM